MEDRDLNDALNKIGNTTCGLCNTILAAAGTNLVPRHFWFRMTDYVTRQLNRKCLVYFLVLEFSRESWRLWHFDWKDQTLVRQRETTTQENAIHLWAININ